MTGFTRAFQKRWFLWLTYVYWITLTLSGFMCAVCYSFTPKPDVIAIQFFIFFAGLTVVGFLFVLHRKHSKDGPSQRGLIFEGRQLESEENTNKPYTTSQAFPELTVGSDTSHEQPRLGRQKHRSRASRCCSSFWRIFNRFLKVIHWGMSVMFIAGGITLALSYRFINPYVSYAPSKTRADSSQRQNCPCKSPNGTDSINELQLHCCSIERHFTPNILV